MPRGAHLPVIFTTASAWFVYLGSILGIFVRGLCSYPGSCGRLHRALAAPGRMPLFKKIADNNPSLSQYSGFSSGCQS